MPPPAGFDPDKYLTAPQVAKLWDVSQAYVRQLCREGKVPGALQFSWRPGPVARQRWYIPRDVAEKWGDAS
jgi:hypothetical protein